MDFLVITKNWPFVPLILHRARKKLLRTDIDKNSKPVLNWGQNEKGLLTPIRATLEKEMEEHSILFTG